MEEELLKKIEKLKNQYYEDIYIKKKNIPELDDAYYELITMLVNNNEVYKARSYAGVFANSISLECRVRINEYLLEHHALIELFNSYGIFFNDFDVQERINTPLYSQIKTMFQKMLKKSQEGLFNLEKYDNKILVYKMNDKLYLIKKDINNVRKIVTENRWMLEDLDDILDYLIEQKYQFTMQDKDLVEYIFQDRIFFKKFIEECFLDKEIFQLLLKKIRYERNFNISEISLLLRNNLDYANDLEVYLVVKDNQKEFLEMISLLSQSNSNVKFKIKTPRIDVDFINQIKAINSQMVTISPERCSAGSIFYSPDELLEINQKIDVLAKSLNDYDGKALSPLEKFISAYIIATNYGIYKESNVPYASRSVYELMRNENNGAIVCVGYVNLLMELLARNGMEDVVLEHGVNAIGEGTYKIDGVSKSNHARLIVYLKDLKYNIDGVYMSDPTWGSIERGEIPGKIGIYHMLMTYEKALMDKEQFPRGVDDLHLNESDLQEISHKLGVDAFLHFHQEIDDDIIIKALCGINRFVSKNSTRMPDTIDISENGYTEEEYNDAALKLGYQEMFVFDESYKKLSVKEMMDSLKEQYQVSAANMSILLYIFFKNNIKKQFDINIDGEKVSLFYNYNMLDQNNEMKYSEEKLDDIYLIGGKAPSDFPFYKLFIKDFSINDNISAIIADINNLQENYDEIVEKEINTIISDGNMIR